MSVKVCSRGYTAHHELGCAANISASEKEMEKEKKIERMTARV